MPPRTRKPKGKPTEQFSDAELDAQLASNVWPIDPGHDAYMLRVAGTPWAEVAEKIGSPTPGAAMVKVSQYLNKLAAAQSAQQMQEALQTQVDRYETILHAWWDKATSGKDEKAATVVLRAMERLDRVQRLTDGEVVVSRETIVISADPAEYSKQLQGVVQERVERTKKTP